MTILNRKSTNSERNRLTVNSLFLECIFLNGFFQTLSFIYNQIERNFVFNCYFGIHFKMECKNEHFRHSMLFYFRNGKNAEQAANKLHDVYGEEALKHRQCQN